MSATVREIFKDFLFDVAEDFPIGLTLGIVTEAQFLDMFNLVLTDFLKSTGVLKRIWTVSLFAGQGLYVFPEDIMDVEDVFVAGRYIPKGTRAAINKAQRDWRRMNVANPKVWYADGLPAKTIGLAPAPREDSLYIPGTNEPDPPFAQYDSFSVVVDSVTYNPEQHRAMTIVGTRKPEALVTDLDEPIPLLQDDFALAYLLSGIEERFFTGDCDLKDLQAGQYSKAQYREGISLIIAATGASGGETD